ncbi:hypothetical protein VHEMI08474 [[Torrubiella] hemipterigena]|uniref:SET domain-containing protein n=1 Tax=[Torrubiella] hemipterigena TaxID=1531966 RepID=A0A0A1TPR7_9HYPO|nr:hypothetical protein VHEMI08474 [[Torrubiella] hemipterigena]
MEDFTEQTAQFLAWFKALPGATFSDAISLVDLRQQEAGRGIVAVKDIEPDTVLFTIPRKSIINVETSTLRELLPTLFEEAEMSSDEEEEEDDHEDSDEEMGSGDEDEDEEPRFDSWSSLILILIYEHLSPSSAWKPYLDVLPTSFNTPMFWDAAELQHLQASATVGKIGKAQAERMFSKLIIPAVRANPKVFAGAEKYSDDDLIALAHRMGSTIMAYAFDLENEDNEDDEEDGWVEDRDGKALMGMVPMADMMNADAEFNAHVHHGDDTLTVTSLRTIRAGEQILNYYGPHPNSELLRRYGYVSDCHARHDVVEVSWFFIEQAASSVLGLHMEALEKLHEALEEEEELEDTFVIERNIDLTPEGLFDEDSATATATIPEDLNEQLKFLLKTVKKQNPALIEDKRKRDEVHKQILRLTVQALASQYPTSAAEDQRLLNQGVQGRERLGVIVRLGEKKILEEVAASLEDGDDAPESSPKKARV